VPRSMTSLSRRFCSPVTADDPAATLRATSACALGGTASGLARTVVVRGSALPTDACYALTFGARHRRCDGAAGRRCGNTDHVVFERADQLPDE
jgi:hypothetical protein